MSNKIAWVFSQISLQSPLYKGRCLQQPISVQGIPLRKSGIKGNLVLASPCSSFTKVGSLWPKRRALARPSTNSFCVAALAPGFLRANEGDFDWLAAVGAGDIK